jgi:hypothetical protein
MSYSYVHHTTNTRRGRSPPMLIGNSHNKYLSHVFYLLASFTYPHRDTLRASTHISALFMA